MKHSFKLFLGLLLSTSVLAETPKTKMPNELRCTTVNCIFGDPSFCKIPSYEHILLTHLNETATWVSDDQKAEGMVVLQDDKIIIDFSESDQISKFTFLEGDMKSIINGGKESISGMLEDGFEWDHTYTRALFVVNCTL
jgi:hypothetical protein